MAVVDSKVNWRISGEEVGSCNCAWGCPCQFNGLPTHGRCEAVLVWDIQEGYFGQTRLDGARFARAYSWPRSIPEGDGARLLILDEGTTPKQRDALIALEGGQQGHPYFEIFAAVCPHTAEPVVAAIELEIDREHRRARARIAGLAQFRIEPIKNPVTGAEHRARIDLPNGFEYKQAEMGNTVSWKVTGPEPLQMEHENTYAQLSTFDWSSDGTSR
jgi:hypothetical protein